MSLALGPSFLLPEPVPQFRFLLTPQQWNNDFITRQGPPASGPTTYTEYSNLIKAQLSILSFCSEISHSPFPTDFWTSSSPWLLNPPQLGFDWLTHPYLHFCLTLTSCQPDISCPPNPMLSPCQGYHTYKSLLYKICSILQGLSQVSLPLWSIFPNPHGEPALNFCCGTYSLLRHFSNSLPIPVVHLYIFNKWLSL